MLKMVLKIGKGIWRIVNETLEACIDVLRSAQNRLIIGLIIFGLGVGLGSGLIASAYLVV